MFRLKLYAMIFAILSFMTTYALGDSHEKCEEWAAANECDKNPTYMREHCANACDQYELIDYSPIDGVESFFDLKASDIDGNLMYFEQFRGRVTIVVNVASFCGYTESHYDGLVKLHRSLRQSDAVDILAFPCNQFGAQEPKEPAWIKSFAQDKGVEFTMMEKIDVNGHNTHPVYLYLKKHSTVHHIDWNFATYFVIAPNGHVFPFTGVEPMELEDVVYSIMQKEL